ncbi:WW domain-containing protein [Entamoeba marina]
MLHPISSSIILSNFGYFNSPVNGFVSCDFLSPTFVSSVVVTVVSRTLLLKNTPMTSPQLPSLANNSNINEWNEMFNLLTPILTQQCIDENNDPNATLECPIGTSRFPFTFSLSNSHIPTLSFPYEQRINFSYQIKATITTTTGTFETDYYLLPMLFHSIPSLQSPPFTNTTPFKKNSSISISLPRTTFFTGERIEATLSLILKTQIHRATLSFVAMYRCLGGIHRMTFNTTMIPLTNQPSRFLIDILPTVPPSIVTQTFRFEHFILIELFIDIGPPLKIFIPVTVVTSQHPQIRDIYMQSIGMSCKQAPFFGIHSRPPPPFPHNINDGFQEGSSDYTKTLFVDHIKRNVHLSKDDDPINDLYPFYESTLLPDGWVIGYNRNERYFIDTKNKSTTWNDPRDQSFKHPQHLLQKSKSVFNILPLCAEGLPTLNKSTPEVYCAIYTEEGKMVKTDTTKSFDPVFKKKTLSIVLDKQRQNVCLYLFAKGKENKCLGYVNLDLSLFPFPSIIEDWFYIFPSPFNSNTTSGRIKLSIAYVDDITDLETVTPTPLTHIITATNTPFYPPTEEYINLAKSHESRYENGNVKMLMNDGGRIFLTHEKKLLSETKQSQRRKSRSNSKKEDSVPLIEVDYNTTQYDLMGANNFEQFTDVPTIEFDTYNQTTDGAMIPPLNNGELVSNESEESDGESLPQQSIEPLKDLI